MTQARGQPIDYKRIGEEALRRARELVPKIVPGGTSEGDEYVVRNPTRKDRKKGSFKFNMDSGLWCEFVEGGKGSSGNDLISYLAYVRGIKPGEAAVELAGLMGVDAHKGNGSSKPANSNGSGHGQNGVVSNEPRSARKGKGSRTEPELKLLANPNIEGGKATIGKMVKALQERRGQTYTSLYSYRSWDDGSYGVVIRWDIENGKEFTQIFYLSVDGAPPKYVSKSPEKGKRPLYRLPDIKARPDEPLIWHEGEKCADKGAGELPEYPHTTVPGGVAGAKYGDYGRVKGKVVIIIRDGNDPGKKYRDDVAEMCFKAGAKAVLAVEPPDGLAPEQLKEWDLAWALENGWTPDNFREWIRLARPIDEVQSPFKVLSFGEFLMTDLPERKMLLEPILPQQGLVLLYAGRGLGKTLVALSIGLAVASGGGTLGWSAPRPARVLYIDGEMPARTMQERIAMIAKGAGSVIDPDFFRIITPDLQENFSIPSLADPETQKHLEPYLRDVELVIIDNISTLCEHGRENEGESWKPIQDFALRMRREGKSVLFVHHAGKGGQQRGTSKREDILDTVIGLRRPTDYDVSEGARFEAHLEKARGIVGDAANPFEATFVVEDNAATWQLKYLEDTHYAQVVELAKLGMTVRDIADDTGLSKSKVQRYKKKAEEAGDVEPSTEKRGRRP